MWLSSAGRRREEESLRTELRSVPVPGDQPAHTHQPRPIVRALPGPRDLFAGCPILPRRRWPLADAPVIGLRDHLCRRLDAAALREHGAFDAAQGRGRTAGSRAAFLLAIGARRGDRIIRSSAHGRRRVRERPGRRWRGRSPMCCGVRPDRTFRSVVFAVPAARKGELRRVRSDVCRWRSARSGREVTKCSGAD